MTNCKACGQIMHEDKGKGSLYALENLALSKKTQNPKQWAKANYPLCDKCIKDMRKLKTGLP